MTSSMVERTLMAMALEGYRVVKSTANKGMICAIKDGRGRYYCNYASLCRSFQKNWKHDVPPKHWWNIAFSKFRDFE